jgi:hypothetical protein
MGSTPRFISGSRAAAVLGISEFQTRREVWQLIKEDRYPGWNAAHGMTLPVFEGNAATRWGLAFEGAVCELAEARFDSPIMNREGSFSRPGFEEVNCHIDGAFSAMASTIFQGKTTNSRSFREKWGDPGGDRIPASYQAQVQHEMLCTGASLEIVSVLVFPVTPDEWEKMGWAPRTGHAGAEVRWYLNKEGQPSSNGVWVMDWARALAEMGFFHQYPVEADPAAQAVMLDTYREFWGRYIEGNEEPPLETSDDVRRAFPEPVGTIVVDDTVEMWIAEREAITSEIGDGGTLAHRKEELTVKILGRVLKDKAVIDEESTEKVILRNAAGKKLASYSTGMLYANRGKSLYINDLSDDELRSVKKYLKVLRDKKGA